MQYSEEFSKRLLPSGRTESTQTPKALGITKLDYGQLMCAEKEEMSFPQ